MALIEIYNSENAASQALTDAEIDNVIKLDGIEVADEDAENAVNVLKANGMPHLLKY